MKKKLINPFLRLLSRDRFDQIGRRVDRWVRDRGFVRPLATVSEIAADIGVTVEQLSLFVRLRAYATILSWRKSLRIQAARELLKRCPELPFAAVATMVGIDDKSNFKRQFVEVTGMTPREWRDRYGNA